MGCKLGDLDLPPRDRDLVDGWCETGTDGRGKPVSAVLLSQALAVEGHKVGPTTVKDHRARRCACD